MASEQEKIEQTVADLQSLREKINKRHFDNVNLLLRINSPLEQIVNSLGTTLPAPAQALNRFTPEPIKQMVGNKIQTSDDKYSIKKPSAKLAQDPEIQMFIANTKATYEGFLGRDADDILKGTDEETIRGVAKLAGMLDFEDAKINAEYIAGIKEAIQDKNKLAKDQNAALVEIEDETTSADAPKPTMAELSAFKKEATEKYTELFGKAPNRSLSGAKIQELVDAKLNEK